MSAQNAWPWDSSTLKPCLQSPVNIQANTAKKSDFQPLVVNIPDDPCVEFTVKLNGQIVTSELEDKCAKRITICGGFLQDSYELNSINYHWGETNELGSEHFFNGESYAGEVQIVTYKKDYKDYDTALQNEDGIVIISFFLQSGEPNAKLNKFIEKVSQLNESELLKVRSGDVQWFLPELQNNTSYFTYPGSLTCPPYTEIVTFIVLCQPVSVAPEQLKIFRCITDQENHQPITSNRREIQPLKGRPILCVGNIKWKSQ